MIEITTEQALKWFEDRKIQMPGARAMYDKAIAALRAQQEAEKNDLLTLASEYKKQKTDLFAVQIAYALWRRKAEAAERDIKNMLKVGNPITCHYCEACQTKCTTKLIDIGQDCNAMAKWRGLCAENEGESCETKA